MNFESLKKNTGKKYLGFCTEKGYIYSVPVDVRKQSVVALKENKVEVLITFTRPELDKEEAKNA